MKRNPMRWVAAMALGCAAVLLPIGPAAYADPEDDSHSIEAELEQAIEDYVEAKDALEAAEDDQKELKADIKAGKAAIEELSDEINDFAKAAYLNGGIPKATTILTAGSPDTAIDGLSVVGYLGDHSGQQLQKYADAQA
ncbi:MAG: coiled-coil domain-containing protein, partial [Stackebrandtia sp.]